MSVDIQRLVGLLDSSLDRNQHKQAETALREAETSPGFSIALLQIVASDSTPLTTRLAAALCFKNLIRRSWTDEDGNYKLPQNEVDAIKQQIVGLMISVPNSIQSQLGDAISVIADSDFYSRWESLTADLVSRFKPDSPKINNGVLTVAHSIFKRWRPLLPSDELYLEINHVQEHFMTPFLILMSQTNTMIEQNKDNGPLLKEYMETMNLSMKILHDLTCQDIPQTIVDELGGISILLDNYLKYDNDHLDTGDENEAGIQEYVKAAVFGVISLWVGKYEDDVKEQVSKFIETSWILLTTTGPEMKYDVLTSRAMGFLTRIASSNEHAQHFNNEDSLRQIIHRVIIPNVTLRESDEELFEDEPIEFIRRDLEGTDSETRRRAATDLLRQLMSKFQNEVTAFIQEYISTCLQEYAKDQSQNWKYKDTAVYLFSSIAALDTVTTAKGAGRINEQMNVIDFFQKSIAQDLVSDSAPAMLQMDAIKYLYIFRGHLAKAQWAEAFPMMIQHLKSSNYVVHTYCAIAVERVLSYTTEDTHEPLIDRSTLAASSKEILQRLFTLIEKDPAPEKVQENEFLMRTIMRILIVIREDATAHTDFIVQNLTTILKVIRHNPSNPRFYYYLFEAIGAFIRFCATSQSNKLEQAFGPTFSEILLANIEEFVPYVFQLFAALLEANPTGELTKTYTDLLAPVLNVQAWEQKGNTPALTRFLCALISRAASYVVENNKLTEVLGVFQHLISKKAKDTYGFDLLETVVTKVPKDSVAPYLGTIWSLLLTRLQSSRTDQFTPRFVRFFYLMSALPEFGPDFTLQSINSVQDGLFSQVYTGVILPETQKLQRALDQKMAVVALLKILTQSQAFAEKFAKGWGYTVEALLKLMIMPPEVSKNDDSIRDQDVDDVSFGVGFTQLSSCKLAPRDMFPEVQDLRQYTGEELKKADGQTNGRIGKFVQERLNDQTRQALMQYMQGGA